MKKKYLYSIIATSFIALSPVQSAHAFDLGKFFSDLFNSFSYAGKNSGGSTDDEHKDDKNTGGANNKDQEASKEPKYVEPVIHSNMKYASNCFNHYIWGAPKLSNDNNANMVYLCKEFYSVGYDLDKKRPLWVSQQLRNSDLKLKGQLGSYNYQYDPEIPRKFQDKTNGNRIRLAPTEIMLSSEDGRNQSFYYTNTILAPKNAMLESIDAWIAKLLQERSLLTIMSGPIFLNKDNNNANYFYKIIVDTQANEAIAFIVPNKPIKIAGTNTTGYDCSDRGKNGCNLFDFSTNILEVQRLTGITFVPTIADSAVLKIKVSDEFINPTKNKPGFN